MRIFDCRLSPSAPWDASPADLYPAEDRPTTEQAPPHSLRRQSQPRGADRAEWRWRGDARLPRDVS